MMPNDSHALSSTEAPADPTQATSSTTDTAVQPSEPTTQDTPSQPEQKPSEESDAVNAWFSQDGDDAGDSWLASEVSAPQQPEPEQLPDQAAPEQPKTETASPAKATTSRHTSSMSFARTVSHEVSFNDDDEGDWNLSRTDTDPFKFMSPSDRTNSFPVVPPMQPSSDTHDHQPLPSNQALDVLEETEKDVDAEEEAYNQQGATDGLDAPRRGHSSSISIGGELKSPEGQASEARFEEGIPLISQSAEGEGRSTEPIGALSSFDDEDADGEDFFKQVEDGANAVPDAAPVPSLERKSTMQVMDSLNTGTTSRQPTLEETPEEDEEPAKPAAATEPAAANAVGKEDLESKWEQAFADDDDEDFLLEDAGAGGKAVDPAAFFGSDDEGFLEDEEPTPAPAPQSAPVPVASRQPSGSNPYVPQKQANQHAASPYAPSAPAPGPVQAAPIHAASTYTTSAPGTTPMGSAPHYGRAPPALAEMPKAQSFADKSKGGYHSPYDLPTDLVTNVVKPRKRASMQQLSLANHLHAPVQPPPRSASVGMPGPPTRLTPPSSSHGLPSQHTQSPPKPTTPGLQHHENFFEELPMTSRPHPSSRTSHRGASPARQPPMVHGTHVPSPLMPSASTQMPPPPLPAMAITPSQPPSQPPAAQQPGANLVSPERASPYAALSNSVNHLPPPSSSASRYSPAPTHAGSYTAPPAPASSRYSPAPPATKSHGSYGPVSASAVPAPMLPHQPRTSSPLTHCESSGFEPRLNRVSSLPPTREVEEEDDQPTQTRSLSATHPPAPYHESKHNPASPPKAPRQTPPPPSYASQLTLSPPKQSGPYAPLAASAAPVGFVPPPRAQTQSPSTSFGHKQAQRSADSTRRPSSAHSHGSPVTTKPPSYAPYAPVAPAAPAAPAATFAPRTRGQSINLNMVAPTDGREQDPLQRWRGVPVISWGVGGTVVTSFPKSIPRYGMNQTMPMIVRTPGEVKIQNVKDIEPLQDHLAKFPGPLRGKSKKKETITWLNTAIEMLEKDLPDLSFHSQLSLEVKRSIERLLLWKILRIFIEHDGVLEGNADAEKAVRLVLSPGTKTPTTDDDALFPTASTLSGPLASVTSMQSDGADVSTMDQIRHYLLRGDREKAVWALVDKRLWGHAMLIAHTVEGDLYKRVAQEFVRKEVNYPGHANESMAALYKILSGNYDDCVDELVPVHARAGLQLVSTDAGPGPTKDTLDGLDKWRETLSLVLSNRSVDDTQGLNALGSLLSSYGRAEAAHICFMFGRSGSIFGGLDDPNAHFVLLGADHRQQADQFAKETEALQLSEVYEYGLSLAGGAHAAAGAPHLAAYKLQHAMVLAEYGHRDKALQYCDAILVAIHSQTKRSPYHHPILEAAVEDFMMRLKQAPKEDNGSWISKPSMNKVSDSMWNRFNKFVAGDDNEENGAAGENGPFNRPSGEFSRSPSVSNFDIYGQQSPSFGMTPAQPPNQAPMSAAASRYAPAATAAGAPAAASNPYSPTSQYMPGRTSMDRTSNDYPRSSYEPAYPGAPSSAPAASGESYAPPVPQPQQNNVGAESSGLAPAAHITQSYSPAGYQPYGMPTQAGNSTGDDDKPTEPSQQGFQPLSYGYEPPHMNSNPPEPETPVNAGESRSGGYEPPSFQPYSYEPPSYEPDPEPTAEGDEDTPKPKKKSFMDDDDDDFPSMKSKEKTKSEKDRENEEMFRKAAEEDGKEFAKHCDRNRLTVI